VERIAGPARLRPNRELRCGHQSLTLAFDFMRQRRRIWTIIALGVAAVSVVVAIGVAVGPVRKVGELGRAEAVKGYWASLQEFEKQKGRYPNDNAEIAAFFHTAADSEPVEYVPPSGGTGDEVILWWKDKTVFGVRVGITKSGEIVKK
jgi:hypothetical protein